MWRNSRGRSFSANLRQMNSHDAEFATTYLRRRCRHLESAGSRYCAFASSASCVDSETRFLPAFHSVPLHGVVLCLLAAPRFTCVCGSSNSRSNRHYRLARVRVIQCHTDRPMWWYDCWLHHCVSFSAMLAAISCLLARVRYRLKWNSFSSSVSCLLLKFVRPTLLLLLLLLLFAVCRRCVPSCGSSSGDAGE